MGHHKKLKLSRNVAHTSNKPSLGLPSITRQQIHNDFFKSGK